MLKTRLIICGTESECRFYKSERIAHLPPSKYKRITHRQIEFAAGDNEYREIFITPSIGPDAILGMSVHDFTILGTTYDQPGMYEFMQQVMHQREKTILRGN